MVAVETWTEHATLEELEPSDCAALRAFFYRLSPQSVYRRFWSPIAGPDQLGLQRLLDLDGHDRAALAAVVDGDVVAIARYARDEQHAGAAELAVVVADAWQRQGLATRLIGALGEWARRAGFDRFSVVTLPENSAAIRLVKKLSPDARLRFEGGLIEAEIPLGA